MIGVYKVSTPTYLAAKVLLRSPHRLLPNLIGDRRIVPEFVPYCRGPGPLVDQALWLLDDSRRLAAQRQGLRQNLALYKRHRFADECVEAITKVVGR
jgi:lipid A disaccharide synthetase